MTEGNIFEIKRFAVHDGDGIRTTIFFKGCPIKCVWCHNPEGIRPKPEIAYYPHKCISCGECISVCKEGAHKFDGKEHMFERELCTGCGECTEKCYSEALLYYGKKMSVEDILSVVLEDVEFYSESGGGVTLSGGECLMQADFCAELLKRLKQENIHTAVDTCGFVSRDAIDKVLSYTDIFLYDIKAIDEDIHKKCTGQSNRLILDNLKYIDSLGKKTEVRIPYVPGYNDNQIEKIAKFLAKLKNITKVRVLPYHNYAGSKYNSLGMENTLPAIVPTDTNIKDAQLMIESYIGNGYV